MHVREGDLPYLGFHTHYRVVEPDREDPTKVPLLLLHGGPGSTHNYFELLDSFADLDHRRLVMYDQLGCGDSWDDAMAQRPELWTYETWDRELIAVRKALGLGECHLLGQSWGGMLAIEYLINYQPHGIHSVVLSSTLPSSALWSHDQHRKLRYLPQEEQNAIRSAEEHDSYDEPAYQQALEHFMELFCDGPADPNTPECLTRSKRQGKESYLATQGNNELTATGIFKDWDYTERLSEIRQPALVISGTDDLCGPLVAKTLADGLPDARWELMDGCRHLCFADDTPGYCAILQAWLDAHEWAHRSWPA